MVTGDDKAGMKDVMTQPMPWGVLGLRPTGDAQAVRRAYAGLIRQYRPDSHPREFARVRQAYEQAQEQASYFSRYEDEPDDEAENDEPGAASQPEPAPVELAAEEKEPPASSAGQPAVFIPVVQWDVASDPGTPPDPVSVTQPGDLPWLDAAESFVSPAPQAVAVPLVDGEDNNEADAYITRPSVNPDWAAISQFDATEQLQALIRCWQVNGEQAALNLLRQQLVLASQATIDAGMDYQEQLLQWLLNSEAPPLALVFEAERLLHWSGHAHDIRLQIGDFAAQRLLLLVQLAQDYVFYSRFSGNGWERRLFAAPGGRLPWVAFTTSIQDARLRLQQWRDNCAQAGLPGLLAQLNPAVVRRIEGAVIYSTDIFLALMLVLVYSDAGAFSGDGRGSRLLLGLLSVALVVAACVGWRRLIRLSLAQRFWKRSERYRQNVAGLACVIGLLSLLAIFGLAQEGLAPVRVVAGAVLTVIGLSLSVVFMSGWWWLLLWFEALLQQPWYRPSSTLARLGFLHLQASDATGWAAPPLKERLRLLPAAVSAAWQKRKLRKKNASINNPGAASGMPRWVYWVGFLLLINGLRAVLK